MSLQAGMWNFDDEPIDRNLLRKLGSSAGTDAPDGETSFVNGAVGLTYGAFCTTPEARSETQPFVSPRGYVITWDGRLDNREELITQLDRHLSTDHTDVAIVAAAFERWGEACLHKFIGEWALCSWDPTEKTLILSRDYAATRSLYYYLTQSRLYWCTRLATMVLQTGASFTLDEDYIASYLTTFPEACLTPYKEIRGVPPGKFVKIRKANLTIGKYWPFEPQLRIRYKTDAEYEEHFRYVFRQAVRRRLRSHHPILADLSGGFDSSAIVCMADDIISHEGAPSPRVDTMSYYDQSEPDADDFEYLTTVEQYRGRSGIHVDLERFGSAFITEYSEFVPAPCLELVKEIKTARLNALQKGGYRVSLSGIGGDELNGQAAEFRVQLADLIVQLRLRDFAKQLNTWSLLLRRPWIQLLFQVLLQVSPLPIRTRFTKQARVEPWINETFARRHELARLQLGATKDVRFRLPSEREREETLSSLANQMAGHQPSFEEKRYPYLDRDFVEFVTSIPGDQLLRPGQRRSLMRRALAGILPPQLLLRRTKAAGGRCFMTLMEQNWARLESTFESSYLEHLGYIKQPHFSNALRELKCGNMPVYVVRLVRALAVELWLRDTACRGVVFAAPNELSSLQSNVGMP
jgi:asparagine synthase (glutamine-hydrolysing)